MSTIHDSKVEPAPGSAADPYRYGWRYVARERPDGGVDSVPVPLTLDDLLFPLEEDFAVQHSTHIEDCYYLLGAFQIRTTGDPTAKVLCDCRVRWDVPGLEPLGPDVAVFFGAPEGWQGGTLDVAGTGARPALVIEVTSPDTRINDFGVKKHFYHQARVPLYVIVDARTGGPEREVKLLGFRHAPGGYEPMPLDDRGRLWLEPFDLWLAVAGGRVVCIDGPTGEPIVDFATALQQNADARAQAADARDQAADARDQADRAALTLAEAEARADRADARILAMQEELRRLRGPG